MASFKLNRLFGAAPRRTSFFRDEDGSIALETVILLPVIFWTFLSMFSIFDAFRQYSLNQKAAYTIGDAISRETIPINNDYLDGSIRMFEYLTRSQNEASLRVTSVWYDADADRFYTDWSQVRGWMPSLTDGDVQDWHDRLPVMPDNERIVVVETWSNYDPPFNTGLEEREIRNFVFTRPRYAPRVLFDANS